MVKRTMEELTCPECGFVAKNANGLRGHRQFKHGVRPSGAQLPLQEQDRLITESSLKQRLDALEQRLGFSEDTLPSLLERLQGMRSVSIAEQVLEQRRSLNELQRQQKATANNLSSLKSELAAFSKQLAAAKTQLIGVAKGVRLLYTGTAEQVATVKEGLKKEAVVDEIAQVIKECERGKN